MEGNNQIVEGDERQDSERTDMSIRQAVAATALLHLQMPRSQHQQESQGSLLEPKTRRSPSVDISVEEKMEVGAVGNTPDKQNSDISSVHEEGYDENSCSSSSSSIANTSITLNTVHSFGNSISLVNTLRNSIENNASFINNSSSSSSSSSSLLSIALAKAVSRRQRGEKKPIPEDLKDDRYFERRKRNNLAAKKSRDQRKVREDQVCRRADMLEKENAILRAQVSTLREESVSLRALLLQRRTARRKEALVQPGEETK